MPRPPSLTYSFNNTVNGHKAVSCIVFQMAGSNATQTISDLETLLNDYSDKLPAGLHINIAQLVCNTDVFCFASPFHDKPLPPRLLHPRRVLEGVREGVEHGGNTAARCRQG